MTMDDNKPNALAIIVNRFIISEKSSIVFGRCSVANIWDTDVVAVVTESKSSFTLASRFMTNSEILAHK